MPINRTDIRLRQSQRLDDTDYGGGQVTVNEVISGELNNLFPDISRMDRTYGRVNMRKAYMQVDTEDRSTYYGAHAAMTLDAKDPKVSVCFFSDNNFFSQRKEARSRMEGYLTRGPQLMAALYNDHFRGSQVIELHCPTVVEAPKIGEVLVLVSGLGTNAEFQQYVRITEMSEVVQNLPASDTTFFQKKKITLTLSTRLERDFEGIEAFQGVSGYTSQLKTCIYKTTVADAASYYGVKSLAENATAGSMQIRVDDIQTALLPCTMSTTNSTDIKLDGTVYTGSASAIDNSRQASRSITKSIAYRTEPNGQFHVGTPVERGSLTLRLGSLTLTEDKAGNVIDRDNNRDNTVGSIDYTTGIITFGSAVSSNSGVGSISYVPAVTFTQATFSGNIAVYEGNRIFTYTYICEPVPMPGTLKAHFLSGGKWYVLQDDGRGALKGAEEEVGSGTVNFQTGSVSLSLGAMPDLYSSILLTWAKEARIHDISGGTYDLEFNITLQHQGVAKNTFYCCWGEKNGNYQYGIADDGSGNLKLATYSNNIWSPTGDILGKINYSAGTIKFKPSDNQAIPSCLENLKIHYQYGEPKEVVINDPNATLGGIINLQLEGNIQRGSIEIEWHTLLQQYDTGTSTSNISIGDKRTVQTALIDPTHIYVDEVDSSNNAIGHFKGEDTDFSLCTSEQLTALNAQLTDPNQPVKFEELTCPEPPAANRSVINYAAGTIKFQPNRVGFFPVPQYEWRNTGNSWTEQGTTQIQTFYGLQTVPANVLVKEQEYCFSHMEYKLAPCIFPVSSDVKVRYRTENDSTTIADYFEPAPRSFCIRPSYNVPVVPGSVQLKAGNVHLVDNSNGKLYYDIDGKTGLGPECGTINYTTRIVTITTDDVLTSTAQTPLDIRSIEVIAAAASSDIKPISYVAFRLPGAPLVPKSVYIKATSIPTDGASVGNVIIGSSTEDGRITTSTTSNGEGGMEGTISYTTGFCQVYFGRWVDKNTVLQQDPVPLWAADAVESSDGTQLWEPCSVVADTVMYSCTIASYIALDSTLLGIDTIRLPIDGKVPVFRKGDVVLIHDTKEVALSTGATLETSKTFNFPEQNLGDIAVYDKNGRYFPEVTGGAYCPTENRDKRNYTIDLINGTLTTSTNLDYNVYDLPKAGNGQYTQYVGPFRAKYRVEDMCLCVDTQITGHLGLNQPLLHNYSADTALVSSVLPCGDLRSGAYNEFEQRTWDNVWSDDQRGESPLASYNWVDFPIQIDNKGAIKERWLILFTSANTFDVIGENLGVIINNLSINTNNAAGSPTGAETEGLSADDTSSGGYAVQGGLQNYVQAGGGWYIKNGRYYLQAVSRLTNRVYWSLDYEGFSSGWQSGNCIRFNTDAASYPFWFVRTTLQHPATEYTDKYQFLMRGDSI